MWTSFGKQWGALEGYFVVSDLCTKSTNMKTLTDDKFIEHLHCVLTIMPQTTNSNTAMV